jgi:hypothetical protein
MGSACKSPARQSAGKGISIAALRKNGSGDGHRRAHAGPLGAPRLGISVGYLPSSMTSSAGEARISLSQKRSLTQCLFEYSSV